jgi:hypothetical protein
MYLHEYVDKWYLSVEMMGKMPFLSLNMTYLLLYALAAFHWTEELDINE